MYNLEGLTLKFKVNRILNDKEKEHHLLQNERLRSKPLYHSRIIRMNSTYLECVDKFFYNKGIISAGIIAVTVLGLIPMMYLSLLVLMEGFGEYFVLFLILLLIMFGLLFIAVKFILRKECFAYTHYPILFNRKTRKVHVFRQNGTVMTEDWDKLYFTLTRCKQSLFDWEVRGHRMAADGETVLETFGLPYADILVRGTNSTTWSFWEYVRRYMEEPDELPALADQIKDALDITHKKERFWDGFSCLTKEGDAIMNILFLPITLIYALGRWIANITSKIPRWSAEIEAQCQIEPDDPYLRDAKYFATIKHQATGKSWDPYH